MQLIGLWAGLAGALVNASVVGRGCVRSKQIGVWRCKKWLNEWTKRKKGWEDWSLRRAKKRTDGQYDGRYLRARRGRKGRGD